MGLRRARFPLFGLNLLFLSSASGGVGNFEGEEEEKAFCSVRVDQDLWRYPLGKGDHSDIALYPFSGWQSTIIAKRYSGDIITKNVVTMA